MNMSRTVRSITADELGQWSVPDHFAQQADRRAYDEFMKEARSGASFLQCLGMVYMVGVQAGIEATRAALAETDGGPTPEQIERAARAWVRATQLDDPEYFRCNWRRLPGLRVYVEREIQKS